MGGRRGVSKYGMAILLAILNTFTSAALVATRPATQLPATKSGCALRPALRGIAPAELGENNVIPFTSTRENVDVPSDEVLPFVSIDANQSLALHPAALNALASAPAPVCVLAMAGTARDGKSSWLNMYTEYLRSAWPTQASASPFEACHDLDTCTAGGALRILTGENGAPLPGTRCRSLVLLDTQGLGQGAQQEGLRKLLTLSLLMSSTFVLNVMRQLNDEALHKLGAALEDAKSLLPPDAFEGGGGPDLLVLLRDARLRLQHGGVAVNPDLMLHAALQANGDALDNTRADVRGFFANKTMVQMRQPDEDDLAALAESGVPLAGRPFWASFSDAAAATTDMLRPKVAGGEPLTGEVLAAALTTVVARLNGDVAPLALSMDRAVGEVRAARAEDAVAVALRTFRQLAPRDGRAGRRGRDARAVTGASSSLALLSPASLELSLRNATQASVAAFVQAASPAAVQAAGGEGGEAAASWLRPYLHQLSASLHAAQLAVRQAHAHAQRSARLAGAERRLADARRADREAAVAAQRAKEERRARAKELVGNIAILAVAAATLTPGWLLARVGTSIAAPALAGTPTVLATLGVWRVAHPALSKASRAVTGFASNVGRRFKKITPFWGR